VRKWLDEKTEFFALPDLDAEPVYGALPGIAKYGKEDGGGATPDSIPSL
jgi:hypothetical protein